MKKTIMLIGVTFVLLMSTGCSTEDSLENGITTEVSPEFLDLLMPPYISEVIYETQVTEFPTSFPAEDWELEQYAWVSHGVVLAAFTNSNFDGGIKLMLYDAMEQNPRLTSIVLLWPFMGISIANMARLGMNCSAGNRLGKRLLPTQKLNKGLHPAA